MFDEADYIEHRMMAISELMRYSNKVRLEFDQDLYNMNKKYIDFLKEDNELKVEVYNNFEICTVDIEVKQK
jgi:hypothetical protein